MENTNELKSKVNVYKKLFFKKNYGIDIRNLTKTKIKPPRNKVNYSTII